ncbi:MAG: BREX system P-loop protein BrxC [Bryobacter sp.]|jgi:hypothetical protein|nr:BREX system P-loop protein BrxC [Bryobacter sp. CoA8 C33]
MSMLIKDTLLRDPSKEGLVNNGQARITNESADDNVAAARVLAELRGELSTFVCEGQYAEGIITILSSFLGSRSQTHQKAAWVSGFFGSGKSHLLKMLCHLWSDTKFPDGATARSLVAELPEEVRDLLRELDVAGKRSGGLLAAAGTLPAGTTENVRLSVFSILLRACGLPTQYPQAQFHLWLEERGILDRVKGAVEAAGKKWAQELNNLYVSPLITKALLACDANFATSEGAAREIIKAQFPLRVSDLTTEEFLSMFKRVLLRAGKDGQMPCTILILDEVQQYIGDSETRSVLITEIAEAVSKQLDSQVMLVAAGQSALTGIKLLNKLLDRFTIRIQLSDADVETVTRKVLLRKQPTSLTPIAELLDTHAGEVSRQLQGTKIGERLEDKAIIVEDYPLLPVRRRFWEHCFRQVDTAGTQSQLRSQLRIIHDCVAKLTSESLGRLIPGDDLYEALAPEMVTTGALPREINERIIALGQDGASKRGGEGRLQQRICGLVFLIGQLPTDGAADIGVRATKEHLADLLVDDLAADNGKLRAEVARLLDKLADEGVLMRVGSEFRIQTEEGRNWDSEFRQREAKLKNNVAFFDERRDQLLADKVQKTIEKVKVLHGAAKVPRELKVYRSQDVPQSDGESIQIWLRDGFSTSEKEILNAARAIGVNSATLFVFIPRKSRDELLNLIATEHAAEQTLNAKGAPATPEGQVARQSMESRHRLAKQQLEALVSEIVAGTKVFQGGGNELLQLSLDEKLRAGADASLARLFPRFKEADFSGSAWESAMKRARDGADQPFSPLKYEGPIEQHPVCRQVLSAIGSGKTGTQLRKELESSPFGWPRDAVDAALIALHRSQHVTATLNGVAVAVGQLDQNKVPKTEFRVEKITLSIQDRNALRALYQEVDVKAKGDELDAKAPEFFTALLKLSSEAGGEAPAPARPTVTDIEDIRKLVGNDRLSALRAKEADIKARIAEWKKNRDGISKREPAWQVLERLASHAGILPEAQQSLTQRDAIRSGRMLLADPDPVAPLRSTLADLLRQALIAAQQAQEAAYQTALDGLSANDTWQKLSPADQTRILGEVGLRAPAKPDTSNDNALLSDLDAISLSARRAEAEAIPQRATKAVQSAAKLLKPKTQFVKLQPSLLETEADVDAWLAEQRSAILNMLAAGPVQIQ